MTTTSLREAYRKLFRRQYPDSWAWAALFTVGAAWWGFMSLGAASDVSNTPEAVRAVATAVIFLSFLASAVGALMCRARAYLLAAFVCAAICVWFAILQLYLLAAGHVWLTMECWRGYRRFVGTGHGARRVGY